MERDLNVGNNIILVPKKGIGDINDINSFMETFGKISPREYLRIRNYILNDLYKLGIYSNIQQKYAKKVCTFIDVIIEGNHGRGFSAIIDNPDEIAKFLAGEVAIAIDPNGEENEVWKEKDNVLDWNSEDSDFFWIKKIK
jgi:hypothetical protein